MVWRFSSFDDGASETTNDQQTNDKHTLQLRNNRPHNLSMHIGESVAPALVFEG